MQVATIGLDIAKHVFQVHGADATGKPVLKQRIRRGQVLEVFRDRPVLPSLHFALTVPSVAASPMGKLSPSFYAAAGAATAASAAR
jgi:hypothetical protein